MSKYNPYFILDEVCSRKVGSRIAIVRPEPYGTTVVEIVEKGLNKINGAELQFVSYEEEDDN